MPYKKLTLPLFLLILCLTFTSSTSAEYVPKEITCTDALILILFPEVEKQISNYYKDYLSDGAYIAPYSVELIDLYRTPNATSGYDYTINLKTMPYRGAHISVGLDHITIQLGLNGIVSSELQHIESYAIPPWLENIIIKPLP
ncbi:MAG: DUF3888 domain-containing protein [Cellulosilyticaceae bacterium]